MSPLLSVVLATHNRADDLPRAAHSVLGQAFRDLELVVVDDGSTDSTTEAAEQLIAIDGRVRVVHNKTALGPAAARNVGIETAGGEMVAFCDDDDAWLPDAASTLINFLSDNPDVGTVSAWHQVLHMGRNRTVIYRGPLVYDEHQLLWQNFVTVFAMARRSAFGADIRFDSGLRTCEDWDLWLRCARERPIRTVPRVLYLYRQHEGPRHPGGRASARPIFLEKHRYDMSPACRTYHEAMLALSEAGGRGLSRRLAVDLGESLGDGSFASLAVAATAASSRVGNARRDPGLQARVLARLVSRDPSRKG